MAETLRCYRHPDRETGVSCSECGRPICPDCMTFGPVGIRCPDHSGKPKGVQRVVTSAQRRSARHPGIVTTSLIVINVGIYLLQLAGGASINANSGWIFEHGALYGPLVAQGDWYRLISSAFPPLWPPPPRGEHVDSLVDRPSGRRLSRAVPLSLALPRLRPRRVGGRAVNEQPQRGDGRGVRRCLRNPGRRVRARAPADLRARRERPRVARRRAHPFVPPRRLDRRPSRRARRRRARRSTPCPALERAAPPTAASTPPRSPACWRSASSASPSLTGG